MEKDLSEQRAEPIYRSGTAARLAGIPVDTLRMWERRYQVVNPQTSAHGHRRYAPQDVERLSLIKALVEVGHSIGSIARLPASRLQELHAGDVARPTAAHAEASGPAVLRVAIVGEALAARAAADATRFPRLQIAGTGSDREHAASALHGVSADLLAVELPALREDDVAFVDALAASVGARRAIVSYRFGTEPAVRELRRRGYAVGRAPMDLADIASLGAAWPGPAVAVDVPVLASPTAPPRFDEATLAQLAQAPTTVRCECPRHVVELLLSLQAFERYSAECENRDAADAELHRYLGRAAGGARTLLEEALVRVARAEGIALPTAGIDARG